MIRSMTGFGEAERESPLGQLRVELRTVNHRYLNVNAKLPTALSRFEAEIREWLRGPFSRGHINCTIRLERETAIVQPGIRIDEARAAAYEALFRELGDRFGVDPSPDLGLLMRLGDLVVRDEPDSDETAELEGEALREAVLEAATRAVRMREEEGSRLGRDLMGRIEAIEAALSEIERIAPERLRNETVRLREAVRVLLDGVAVDEARVAQEIAFLAERWDVNEELVRFRSHTEYFRELLSLDTSEAVGKRLGFLVQEMHREANTIGSKANHATIAQQVVMVKEEIERLREQVENVE